MSQFPIKFKGSSFTLFVVYLYNHEPEIVCKAIQSKLKQVPCFPKNMPIVLNIEALNQEVNWEKMKQAILATGLYIVGIIGCKHIALKKVMADIGLPILKEIKKQHHVNHNEFKTNKFKSIFNEELYNKTLIIKIPVRSGQQIYSRNADLVITGNVSAGAELISDGNIHIYGIMRGKALAGASGNHDCQIFCSSLAAELISIAGKYWVMDQIPKSFYYKSACLYLKDGVLTIQKLN
ncbi:septum site-determining protein MinC [Candidatus Pantoea edessiphila]|uniref:Probable septum site-determining protein MinC n=1 Tax=Candidatus Pantoea edessiphila TaxID=2044610 RepID=A0A2P5T2M7_9GAMM|nr:septum site-determining protein MinC [Candidatus Pantoea edessiphila]PPI88841.1 septum site-determining protein MinC [Candidatus Pantoea edessiphila]